MTPPAHGSATGQAPPRERGGGSSRPGLRGQRTGGLGVLAMDLTRGLARVLAPAGGTVWGVSLLYRRPWEQTIDRFGEQRLDEHAVIALVGSLGRRARRGAQLCQLASSLGESAYRTRVFDSSAGVKQGGVRLRPARPGRRADRRDPPGTGYALAHLQVAPLEHADPGGEGLPARGQGALLPSVGQGGRSLSAPPGSRDR